MAFAFDLDAYASVSRKTPDGSPSGPEETGLFPVYLFAPLRDVSYDTAVDAVIFSTKRMSERICSMVRRGVEIANIVNKAMAEPGRVFEAHVAFASFSAVEKEAIDKWFASSVINADTALIIKTIHLANAVVDVTFRARYTGPRMLPTDIPDSHIVFTNQKVSDGAKDIIARFDAFKFAPILVAASDVPMITEASQTGETLILLRTH